MSGLQTAMNCPQHRAVGAGCPQLTGRRRGSARRSGNAPRHDRHAWMRVARQLVQPAARCSVHGRRGARSRCAAAPLSLWCQLGLLRQPMRRVYVAAQVPDSLMLRAQCLSLVVPDDAVICDRHAGWLLGAEMVLAPNEHLDLAAGLDVPPPTGDGFATDSVRQRRAPSATRGHHRGPGAARDHHAEDCLGSGPRPLARARDQRHGPDASPAWLPARRFPRGCRAVPRRALGHDSASARPTGRRSRRVASGVDPPAVLDRRRPPLAGPSARSLGRRLLIARLDIGNAELCYAVEYDGAEWHSSPEQLAHDKAASTCRSRAGLRGGCVHQSTMSSASVAMSRRASLR